MKDKKGQALGITVAVLLIVVLLGGIGGGVYWFTTQGTTQAVTEVAEAELSVTGDCETVPYITVTARDAINLGTPVTIGTIDYAKNGVFQGVMTSGSSGTKFQFGDKVELLINTSNYLNTVIEDIEVKCGDNAVLVDLFGTDDGTIKIFDEDGTVVTDNAAGGANNQSSSATTIQQEIKITSKSDQSLGDMVIIVEASNTTQVDKILLSDGARTTVSGISVPEFHTQESSGTGSIVKAFFIDSSDYLQDGKSDTYTLSIEPESGQTIGVNTAIYVTAYTQQHFRDIDGSFVYEIENSDGSDMSEDNFDYDYLIV